MGTTYTAGPRDLWSFRTHGAGALLSVAATVVLIVSHLPAEGSLGCTLSYVAFGLSLIALYTCSAIYHFCNGPDELLTRLRKLDHSMIYVLIAGTYTPIIYALLPGKHAAVVLSAVWAAAAAGILMKIFWLNAPRILYTSLYLIMGWAMIAYIGKLYLYSPGAAVCLLAGGAAYTAGAIIYMTKKPNFFKSFGFHEIFHVFILIGSLLHFISIEVYV